MSYGVCAAWEVAEKLSRKGYVPLRDLAAGWGVPRRALLRDFKWWCHMHGKDPVDFYYRGYRYTGYWAPKEFWRWWVERMLPQYQRTGHARRVFDFSAAHHKWAVEKLVRVV